MKNPGKRFDFYRGISVSFESLKKQNSMSRVLTKPNHRVNSFFAQNILIGP